MSPTGSFSPHPRSVPRGCLQGGCQCRTLPHTPEHVLHRQGAVPGALPGAGNDSDTGPPHAAAAETSPPLPPSRSGLWAGCCRSTLRLRGHGTTPCIRPRVSLSDGREMNGRGRRVSLPSSRRRALGGDFKSVSGCVRLVLITGMEERVPPQLSPCPLEGFPSRG